MQIAVRVEQTKPLGSGKDKRIVDFFHFIALNAFNKILTILFSPYFRGAVSVNSGTSYLGGGVRLNFFSSHDSAGI